MRSKKKMKTVPVNLPLDKYLFIKKIAKATNTTFNKVVNILLVIYLLNEEK